MWARAASTFAVGVGLTMGFAVGTVAWAAPVATAPPTLGSSVDAAAQVASEAMLELAAAGAQPLIGQAADHRFLLGGAERPVRWNPCQPITWAFATDSLGEEGRVEQAFAVAGRASGIAFTRLPEGSAAQVRVTLQSSADGSVSGDGGMRFTTVGLVTGDGLPVATSGYLDAVIGAGSTEAMRTSLYLHELGHVLGLDHVDATDEVMQVSIDPSNPLTRYSAGDLEGLRRLGRTAGCQNPPPRMSSIRMLGKNVKPAYVRAVPGRGVPTFHPTRVLAFAWNQPPADPPVTQTLAFQVDTVDPTNQTKWSPLPFDNSYLGAGEGDLHGIVRVGGDTPCRAGDQFVLVSYNAFGKTANPVSLDSCL